MVSAAAEEALHPKPSADGSSDSDAQQSAALVGMSNSLTASRNVMAALAPLPVAMTAAFDAAAAGDDAQAASAALPTQVSGGDSAGGVDMKFRLYKAGSGKQLQRVELSQDVLSRAFSDANEDQWERVLTPAKSALEKDLVLASLLDQPLAADSGDAAVSAEESDIIPQLMGVCVMHALPPLARTATNATYSAAATGEAASQGFRLYMQKDGQAVSPWHDVPLRNAGDGTLNFICEIPKGTTAKMEVATGETGTPIKQDIKKGKLRHYHEPINWNYGLLPQTFEDPDHVNNECGGVKGDNDPVDVVEIGSKTLRSGGVYRVRPLGAYAMIDEGELDWKIIVVRVDDPLADRLHDISDVERELPGELERIMTWFRDYKIPDGKPANAFGFDYKPLDAAFAHRVVAETHEFYTRLRAGTLPNHGGLALA